MKKTVTFKEVPVKGEFKMNGNTYFKSSTRTARLAGIWRVFYFKQTDVVKLTIV